MARGRSVTFLTRIVDADGSSRRMPDHLAVEEPLEIQLDDTRVATTMRTPGHDFELAVGWCHSEGLLEGVGVDSVRYCGTGSAVDTEFNVVSVVTDRGHPPAVERLSTTSTSCGLCGSTVIDALVDRIAPLPAAGAFDPAVLAAVVDHLRDRQPLFAETGAVHAAGLFDASGELVIVREDVGRHNAVDKVAGRLVLDGRVPASDLGLVVSGRASFEMVQKAWAIGCGTVVAVSAPSALAVEVARRAGMTLAGFVRGGGLRLYAGPGVE